MFDDGYSAWGAYSASKLANVYHCTELSRRLKGKRNYILHLAAVWFRKNAFLQHFKLVHQKINQSNLVQPCREQNGIFANVEEHKSNPLS